MPDVITFKPLYKQRVWGGRGLEALYGRSLPAGNAPIGESWEVVDRENEQSVVESGEFAGRTLHELWSRYPEQVFGRGLPPSRRFPLLLKILDARQRLSVQVHPPTEIACKLGGSQRRKCGMLRMQIPVPRYLPGFGQGSQGSHLRRASVRG